MSPDSPASRKMTLARRAPPALVCRDMKLGVIGCGKMGSALVEGAIRAGTLTASQVSGYDPSPEAARAFADATGARLADGVAALDADTFLLCTKPQHAAAALAALPAGEALVISVAAGLSTAFLERHAPAGIRVVRCMPNTPALVGKGAAAFCRGSAATSADAEAARLLLGSVGLAVELPESLMDAVTGLSGSGPAYIFLIIEALADGGVKAGLARAQAQSLAAQTVFGSAKLLIETGEHPGRLKDQVTSPGGTAIAGLHTLEAGGLRTTLMNAVESATNRSRELGRKFLAPDDG